MKNIIRLLMCMLVLLGVIQVNGQSATGFEAVKVNNKTQNVYKDNGFDIRVAFKYNLKTYKQYRLKVKYKTALTDYNSGSLPNTESNIVAATPVTVETDGAYTIVTYTVIDTKLVNDEKDHSISMTFSSFINRQVNNSCTADIDQEVEIQAYAIDATCQSNCNSYILIGTDNAKIITPKATENNNYSVSVSAYRLQPTANYYTPVAAEVNASYPNGLYTSATLTIEFPSDKLNYLLFNEFHSYYFDLISSSSPVNGTIPPPVINQNTGIGTITFTINRPVQFRLYFSSKVNATLDPAIKVTMTGAAVSCTGNNLVMNATSTSSGSVELVTSANQSFKPVIEGPWAGQNVVCNANCNYGSYNSYIYFEANRLYDNNNTAQTIKITVPQNVHLTNLNYDDSQYGGGTTPQLKYWVGGQSTTISPSGNVFYLPDNITIDYLEITGLTMATKAIDFALYFKHVLSSANEQKYFVVSYLVPQGTNFIEEGTKTIEVANPSNVSCDGRTYIRDDYSSGTYSAGNNPLFSPGGTGFVILTLRPVDENNPANFTFDLDYTLESHMTFANSGLRFFKSNSYYRPSDLSSYSNSLATLLSAQDWTLASGGYIKINGNKIEVRGLKLKNSCTTAGNKLFIVASVKVAAETPYQNYLSSVADLSSTGNLYKNDLSYWYVPSYFNLSSEVFLSCNDQNFPGGNVKPGDVISIRYMIRNTSTDNLSGFTINGKLLKFGNTVLTPQAVTGFILNNNNGETDISSYVSNSYPTPEDIQVLVNGAVVLSGFQRLFIDVKYAISAGASLNAQNLSSFSASSAQTNVVTSNPISILVSNNSICGTVVEPPQCAECITSFAPVRGKRYLISGWLKEQITGILPASYVNSGIKITFNNGLIADLATFKATGPVVDGWQRVESSFIVPQNANNIQVELVSENNSVEVYFDDIRIHPFRSNMKSFVYDPSSQRLTAELDENNYATLYEYDDEGILIRVKKETERGIMTIKESRNNQSKIFKNEQ